MMQANGIVPSCLPKDSHLNFSRKDSLNREANFILPQMVELSVYRKVAFSRSDRSSRLSTYACRSDHSLGRRRFTACLECILRETPWMVMTLMFPEDYVTMSGQETSWMVIILLGLQKIKQPRRQWTSWTVRWCRQKVYVEKETGDCKGIMPVTSRSSEPLEKLRSRTLHCQFRLQSAVPSQHLPTAPGPTFDTMSVQGDCWLGTKGTLKQFATTYNCISSNR
jgi:hypothetical protein